MTAIITPTRRSRAVFSSRERLLGITKVAIGAQLRTQELAIQNHVRIEEYLELLS